MISQSEYWIKSMYQKTNNMRNLIIYYLLVDAVDGTFAMFFESEKLAKFHKDREECRIVGGVLSLEISILDPGRYTDGLPEDEAIVFCEEVITVKEYLEDYVDEDDLDYNQIKIYLKNL